jgi:Protein of unknown function (DUF2849)
MAAPAPQMLTANRLSDGVVLYWKHGAWVEALADGEALADNAAADAALAAAQASVADNAVVGVYLFDLRADGSPVKEREIIRAAGPSVREDLGKQADESTSPSWGGRKIRSAAKNFSGGGDGAPARPPPEKSCGFFDLPTRGR